MDFFPASENTDPGKKDRFEELIMGWIFNKGNSSAGKPSWQSTDGTPPPLTPSAKIVRPKKDKAAQPAKKGYGRRSI